MSPNVQALMHSVYAADQENIQKEYEAAVAAFEAAKANLAEKAAVKEAFVEEMKDAAKTLEELAARHPPRQATKPVLKDPAPRDAIALVLGGKSMNVSQISKELEARGWTPNTNDVGAYVRNTLEGNPERYSPVKGPGKKFQIARAIPVVTAPVVVTPEIPAMFETPVVPVPEAAKAPKASKKTPKAPKADKAAKAEVPFAQKIVSVMGDQTMKAAEIYEAMKAKGLTLPGSTNLKAYIGTTLASRKTLFEAVAKGVYRVIAPGVAAKAPDASPAKAPDAPKTPKAPKTKAAKAPKVKKPAKAPKAPKALKLRTATFDQPSLKARIISVLGDQAMKAAEIYEAMKAKGLALPDSANPKACIGTMLAQAKAKGIFEVDAAKGKGYYRVKIAKIAVPPTAAPPSTDVIKASVADKILAGEGGLTAIHESFASSGAAA